MVAEDQEEGLCSPAVDSDDPVSVPQGLCKAVKAHFAPVRTQTEQEEVLAVVRVTASGTLGGGT